MTGPTPPVPHESVDPAEWAALVSSVDADGVVDANNVAHVLRNVELTEDLLRHTESVLNDIDITISRVEPDISGPIERVIPEKQASPVREITSRSRARGPAPETGDSVRLYLHEIGQVQLLSAEDERNLGRAIRAMQEARPRMKDKELSGSERYELRRVVREGDEALEHLVKANLRLVVSIARKYDGRELPLADLIQEGNIGLMRAAEKYDWEKGFKFSTYATWWIRQSMMRAMADQGRTIRVPSHVVDQINRVTRAERDLTVELERDPTLQEVSERTLIPVDRIEELKQIASVSASLDERVSSEDDAQTYGDKVTDKDAPDVPADAVQRSQLLAALAAEMNGLPERDRRILEMRFGMATGKEMTLDEVARREGVTRERIRQIEQKALSRMRHPNNSQKLRSFLDDI